MRLRNFILPMTPIIPISWRRQHALSSRRVATTIASVAICLIHQANYLIDQPLKTREKESVEKGGLRERMTRARLNHRSQCESVSNNDVRAGKSFRRPGPVLASCARTGPGLRNY
jgi:four helix bundle suffix protein